MRRILRLFLLALVVLVVVSGAGLLYLSRGLQAGSQVTLQGVELSQLADGRYCGSYCGGRWSNEVCVTIKNNRIVAIEVVDDVTFVKDGVREELLEKVIAQQNTRVDAVSGATVTSKAYLKAIENALTTK